MPWPKYLNVMFNWSDKINHHGIGRDDVYSVYEGRLRARCTSGRARSARVQKSNDLCPGVEDMYDRPYNSDLRRHWFETEIKCFCAEFHDIQHYLLLIYNTASICLGDLTVRD